MNTDIILSGVGGQGILSIATIIGAAAIKEKLYIKQAEVHGMSQRGGDVQSQTCASALILYHQTSFLWARRISSSRSSRWRLCAICHI